MYSLNCSTDNVAITRNYRDAPSVIYIGKSL